MEPKNSFETRTISEPFEVRESEEKRLTAGGMPIVFNRETVLYSSKDFEEREIISPGAVDIIGGMDVRALWNHNRDIPLARTKGGTLRLFKRDGGIDCEIDFPDSEEGRSKFALIRSGVVDGMSFGFILEDSIEEERKEGGKVILLRTITKVRLIEVSPCTIPAYSDTTISARAQEFLSKRSAELSDSTAAAAFHLKQRARELEIMKGEVL